MTDEGGNIVANPVTKEAFGETAIKVMVRSEIIRHERAQLAAQAKQQAAQAAHNKYSAVK